MNESALLMNYLKETISERHARMEALPFIVALTGGQLPQESYVGQLRALAIIQGTLEHESTLIKSEEIRTLLLGRPSRLIHLRKDLSIFDALLIPDIQAANDYARRIAGQIRLARIEQPTDLLGILYVLQGTTLGNTIHLPDVLKTFGGQTSGAAHYYAGYGPETSKYWKEFSSAMNAFPLAEDDRRHLIQAALDFFDGLEGLFSMLYPIQNAKMVYTAGMLNPEAGDHAVPGDVKEIEAAVYAARKCREEFPYFDARYQERGRSFAKSDAAWLATLVELPQAHLFIQVEWLGRVLSNRGMPRITLESQLEILYESMSAAVPAKNNQYKGLLEVAESLKRERLRYIPEPVFQDLASEFRAATDGELQGRFRRTGDLIISAVCDEEAGITGAIGSLLPWLTDAERFPAQWITAVIKTLEQSRKYVQGEKPRRQ